MTEAQWQKQVVDLAHTYHWRVAHFRAARMPSGRYATPVQADGAGFPDLVLVRDGRLIFAELKVGTGKLSSRQVDWFVDLDAVADEAPNVIMRVWFPADVEAIKEDLK